MHPFNFRIGRGMRARIFSKIFSIGSRGYL